MSSNHLRRMAARSLAVLARHAGHAALAAKLDQAQESTLENTLAAAPTRDLIHPGVLKYMKEIGLC